MNLKEKAQIICEVGSQYSQDSRYKDFFEVNKIGILIAKQNYCGETLSETEISLIEKLSSDECDGWINSTWLDLCQLLGDKDPNGHYDNLGVLIKSEATQTGSSYTLAKAALSADVKPIEEAFKRGSLIQDIDENELRAEIDDFIENGEKFSDSHRFLFYGLLSNLRLNGDLYFDLIEHVNNFSDEEDEGHFDRGNLLNFLLRYSVNALSTQLIMPENLSTELKKINYEQPLLKQNADGTWNDLVVNNVIIKKSDELAHFIKNAASKNAFGNNCNTDGSFDGDCCLTSMIFSDVDELTDTKKLLPDMDFEDYKYSVWTDYWYPEFLLMAYANPSNVFTESIDVEFETQWCGYYEDEMPLCPLIPVGMAQILRFTPRILSLLSSKLLSNHFEEIPDNKINLFKGLKHTRPEANNETRDAIVKNYLKLASKDSDEALESYLDEDTDFTKFFEIISACLYTTNSRLLEKLAQIEDEVTKMCVLLNPSTSSAALENLSDRDFELVENIKFETGFPEDSLNANESSFATYMAGVASNCGDNEFADILRNREINWTVFSQEESNKPSTNFTFSAPKITIPSQIQAKLVSEFADAEMALDNFKKFFTEHSLGVAIAYSLNLGDVVLLEAGEAELEYAYNAMCRLFGKNPNDEFESYAQLRVHSKNE